MNELALPEQIILPLSGEVVLASDPQQVARALDHMREIKRMSEDAARALSLAFAELSKQRGSQTIALEGGASAVISSGEQTVYDPVPLMEALREAGMPEDILSELIVETVEYKVDAVRVKQAARANPAYAAAVNEHSRVEEKARYVTLKGMPHA